MAPQRTHFDNETQNTTDGKKWTLLWIPATGLMYDGGNFFDGNMRPISWDRTIKIFSSHARAETAKKKTMDIYPDAKGEIVILPVWIQKIGEGHEEEDGAQ